MEIDGTKALTKMLQVIGFHVLEDQTKDLQLGRRFVRYYHIINQTEITLVVLDEKYTFNEFLISEIHSGLMNAILPAEYISCFPILMENGEVIAHGQGINSEAVKAKARGFNTYMAYIENEQADEIGHYAAALDRSITSGYVDILEGSSE